MYIVEYKYGCSKIGTLLKVVINNKGGSGGGGWKQNLSVGYQMAWSNLGDVAFFRFGGRHLGFKKCLERTIVGAAHSQQRRLFSWMTVIALE